MDQWDCRGAGEAELCKFERIAGGSVGPCEGESELAKGFAPVVERAARVGPIAVAVSAVHPRSAVDRNVHHRGIEFAFNAVDPKEQFHTIQLAKSGLTYAKARREQDMENLTNQFARLSINDVSVTDVFPLAR